jgi:hypothetical protein
MGLSLLFSGPLPWGPFSPAPDGSSPLSHAKQVVETFLISEKAMTTDVRGTITKLLAEVQTFKPVYFPGSPGAAALPR